MKTIAYLRVSTAAQDNDNQRLAIWDYAYPLGLRIDELVSVEVSSRKNWTQRKVDHLLNRLSPGDTLLVSELSRLGRSLSQIIFLVDQLIEKQVRFVAIKEGIELEGSTDLRTKVMITLFGLFAEIERDLISERTKEGLAKARLNGKRLGRPKGKLGKSKLSGKEEEIRLLLQKGVSLASIAKIMGVF
jgi:DNA invertase Pin-like site-specific DNA recombinase